MAIAFYMVLTFSAMNDIIALKFHISLNATTRDRPDRRAGAPAVRVLRGLSVGCRLAAQRPRVLEHGVETGIIKRLPHGAYVELHQPLGPVDEHGHPIPLEYEVPRYRSG